MSIISSVPPIVNYILILVYNCYFLPSILFPKRSPSPDGLPPALWALFAMEPRLHCRQYQWTVPGTMGSICYGTKITLPAMPMGCPRHCGRYLPWAWLFFRFRPICIQIFLHILFEACPSVFIFHIIDGTFFSCYIIVADNVIHGKVEFPAKPCGKFHQ